MQPERPTDLRDHREWLVSLAPIPDAGVWADIGCGEGDDLLLAAGKQPSLGLRLVGLDSDAESIEAARRRAGADDSRVQFLVHKLEEELPFEAASLDVVYANNLLECLPDRPAFTREIARVLKPGGWVVVAHWDWDSQFFDSTDKHLVRRLVAAFADWQQPWMDQCDSWMGRRLWGTFQPSGLFEGAVEARVMINTEYAAPWYGHARAHDFGALVGRGLASQVDYERFLREQDALSKRGQYFYSITGFAYVGRRTV